jgi:hypothetical protein
MVLGERGEQLRGYMYFCQQVRHTVSLPHGLSSKAKTFKLAELWKKANHIKWAQRSAHVFAFATRNG